MKRLTLVPAIILWLATPAIAQSQTSPFYLQLDGGGSFLADNDAVGGGDLSYDPGYVIGGRLGYRLTDAARIELNLDYSTNEVDEIADLDLTGIDVDLSSFFIGASAYADLFDAGLFTPYVGGGAGVALWEVDIEAFGLQESEDETDFTANAEAGIALEFARNLSIVPHYRLVWIDGIGDDEQFAHWLRVGLRYSP